MLSCFEKGEITVTDNGVTWKICNFFYIPIDQEIEIRSPQFVFCKCRYTLVIWPRGHKGYGVEDYFGICLYKYDKGLLNESVQFSLVTKNGAFKTTTVTCSENNNYMEKEFMKWSDFCNLRKTIALNGCLTIECKISDKKEESEEPVLIAQAVDDGSFSEYRHSSDSIVIYKAGDHASGLAFTSSVPDCPAVSGCSDDHPVYIGGCFTSAPSSEELESSPEDKSTEPESHCKIPCVKAIPGTELPQPEKIRNNFTYFDVREGPQYPDLLIRRSTSSAKNEAFCPQPDSHSLKSQKLSPKSVNKLPNRVENHGVPKKLGDAQTDVRQTKRSQIYCTKQQISPCNPCSFPTFQQERPKTRKDSGKRSNDVELCVLQPGKNIPSVNCKWRLSSASPKVKVSSSNACRSHEMLNPPSVQHQESSSTICMLKGLEKLSKAYKKMYLNSVNCNLTIIMQGREFPVHSNILISRSPVFADLLAGIDDENNSNTIQIDPFDDYNEEVFHVFLIYVYSAKVEDVTVETVCGLYSAATEYMMPELKEECIDMLKKSLSIETIPDVVHLAVKHNEFHLLEIATAFFAENLPQFIGNEKWRQYHDENPTIATNIFEKALNIGYKKVIT